MKGKGKYMDFKEYFEGLNGKKITVAGAGVSNTPLIKMLVKYGAVVTVCDGKKTEEELKAQFEGLSLNFKVGEKWLDDIDADIIFRSPGIRPDLDGFNKAVEKGAYLTSEMEVFFDLCPCDIFAITGSDGKTTTTTLTYNMLKNSGYTVHLGGNIGKPLLPEIDKIEKDHKVVLELSSFQLFTIKKSGKYCGLTNLSPNHLDWHKDYKEYIDAKKNIFIYDECERLVTNLDNKDSVTASKDAKNVIYFSRTQAADICLKDGFITVFGEKVLDTNEILLPGLHNIENYMTAIGVVWGVATKDGIKETAKTVKGVEHRIEFVREFEGVKYYNDSIASSPNRTITGLKSFEKKVILIAGGKDKNIPYDEIGDVVMEKVKKLVLTGATAPKIKEAVLKSKLYTPDFEIIECDDFKDAVISAKNVAEKGDIVILSPASTSFDKFKNFEERGRVFKDIVNSL